MSIPAAALAFALATVAPADTVVRQDGSQVEGEVISLDDQAVLVRTQNETVRIPRDRLASIHFSEPPLPSLKVEVRNVRSDDSLDILLDDQVILREARERGEWIDITERLKKGNNPLRLRIRNARGIWAYHVNIRINGVITNLSCGTPLDRNRPCRCCGKTGREVGVIEDIPVVWLHVDRERGTAEILP